jgi:hypothetical protein
MLELNIRQKWKIGKIKGIRTSTNKYLNRLLSANEKVVTSNSEDKL